MRSREEKERGLKYLAIIALLLIPTPTLAAYTPSDLLLSVNRERQTAHEAPLKVNAQLQKAAEAAATDLARTESWSHNGAWIYLIAQNYRWTWAGQNLARKFNDTPQTVQAWMNSPTHRANILFEPFRETGIALAASTNGDIYVVQYFGTP
jgi:uncharacterized protein YkwD